MHFVDYLRMENNWVFCGNWEAFVIKGRTVFGMLWWHNSVCALLTYVHISQAPVLIDKIGNYAYEVWWDASEDLTHMLFFKQLESHEFWIIYEFPYSCFSVGQLKEVKNLAILYHFFQFHLFIILSHDVLFIIDCKTNRACNQLIGQLSCTSLSSYPAQASNLMSTVFSCTLCMTCLFLLWLQARTIWAICSRKSCKSTASSCCKTKG